MRLRHIPGCEEFVWNSIYTINNPEDYRGRWSKLANGRPIHVEIGMGKGKFIREMSRLNPDVFYIGIERYESVLQKAIERVQRDDLERGIAEGSREDDANLYFLCMDAERLPVIFDNGEVDRIYLNFSDPWPKARHENRRLTSGNFMNLYKRVLKEGGWLEFKTDNNDLFEYSTESVPAAGWKITYLTRDLHAENIPNVMTEYEEKFSGRGQKINKLVAVPD